MAEWRIYEIVGSMVGSMDGWMAGEVAGYLGIWWIDEMAGWWY